jgi:hypothetical protein
LPRRSVDDAYHRCRTGTRSPPAYHRAQARLGPTLHIDALTLVRTLHLLTLCRLEVRLAHRRPRIIRLDAAYWGLRLIAWIHATLHTVAVVP